MSKKKKNVEMTPEEKIKSLESKLANKQKELDSANHTISMLRSMKDSGDREIEKLNKCLRKASEMIAERNEWLDCVISALKKNRKRIQWLVPKLGYFSRKKYEKKFLVPAEFVEHTDFIIHKYMYEKERIERA